MSERTSDVLDAGADLAEQDRSGGLVAQRRRAARDQRPLAAGETERICAGVEGDDCDELVESNRLHAIGAIRCITCQSVVERMRKLKGEPM